MQGGIIDILNYPSEFVGFALGNLLIEHPTPFSRFTRGGLDNPGATLGPGCNNSAPHKSRTIPEKLLF